MHPCIAQGFAQNIESNLTPVRFHWTTLSQPHGLFNLPTCEFSSNKFGRAI